MTSTLVRGKYVICKITGASSAEVVADGAVLQRDGEVIMRNRQLTRVDKEGLFKELRKALDRPLSADELERRELSRLAESYLRRFYERTMPQGAIPFTSYNARS